MIRPKLILASAALLIVLFIVGTYLDPIHRGRVNSLREPPIPKLSDYPRLKRHCCFCPSCRERCGLVSSNLLDWDSPPLCGEGIRVFIEDFKERWDRLK